MKSGMIFETDSPAAVDVEVLIIAKSFRPPPEGMRLRFAVSRSPGLRIRRFFPPSRDIPVAHGSKLSAYSCGGSHGLDEQSRLHRIPSKALAGTDDRKTI
jgi:hypothetical protein